LVTTGLAGIGFTVTAKLGDTIPFPQELVPITVMIPEAAVGVKSTVMERVFAPPTIFTPVGTVHVYPVALAIEVTE
jgi:hypothetical protein